MQERGKFSLKINVIPNRLEKFMSFSINNNINFIDSSQFLSSSLDTLVKNLNKDGFKYLSQEFDNNVLDLVKQKACILMSIWVFSKNISKNGLAKKSFIVPWTAEDLWKKNINMFLMFWKNLKWKQWKIIMICI